MNQLFDCFQKKIILLITFSLLVLLFNGSIFIPIEEELNKSKYPGIQPDFSDLRIYNKDTHEEIPYQIIKKDSKDYLIFLIPWGEDLTSIGDDCCYNKAVIYFRNNTEIEPPYYEDSYKKSQSTEFAHFFTNSDPDKNDNYFNELVYGIFNLFDACYTDENQENCLSEKIDSLYTSFDASEFGLGRKTLVPTKPHQFDELETGPILDIYSTNIDLDKFKEKIIVNIYEDAKIIDIIIFYELSESVDKIYPIMFLLPDFIPSDYNFENEFPPDKNLCVPMGDYGLFFGKDDLVDSYFKLEKSEMSMGNNNGSILLNKVLFKLEIINPSKNGNITLRINKYSGDLKKKCNLQSNIFRGPPNVQHGKLESRNISEQNLMIESFFAGSFLTFNPELPNANIKLIITTKEDFPAENHTIYLTYDGISNRILENVGFNKEKERYEFSGEVVFSDSIWKFPFDKHISILTVDDNTSFRTERKAIQTPYDSNLFASVKFEDHTIFVSIERNKSNYWLSVFIFILLLGLLGLHLRNVNPKDIKRPKKLLEINFALITVITFTYYGINKNIYLLSIGTIPFIIGWIIILYYVFSKK